MTRKKKTVKRKVKRKVKPMCRRHGWVYFGGEARCSKCRRYLQPDGRVTNKP